MTETREDPISPKTESEPERFRPNRLKKAAMGAEIFSVSPFSRLARPHAFSVGGDALVTIALADSVFFSLDPSDARWRVLLYLIFTVAPFGVVAQFLGPLVEKFKSGTKLVLVGSGFTRGAVAVLMATQVDTLLFFPLAFTMLVLGKAHHIAKSALVPGLIGDPEKLVQANSRLSVISAVSGGLAAIPGVLLLKLGVVLGALYLPVSEDLGGAPWTLTLAGMSFILAGVLGLSIPASPFATEKDDASDDVPALAMRRSGVLLASSAMAYVRGVTGFLTLLLAFSLRGGVEPGPIGVGVEMGHRVRAALGAGRLDLSVGGSPAWHFGIVVAASGIGGFAGALLSPRLRQHFPEERVLAGMLGVMSVVGLVGALLGGLAGAMAVAGAVAFGGSIGKQAFDAIVQRDSAPQALSHEFATFESRFQLVWVFGAILPVILPIPARWGFLLIAVTAGFAAVSYWLGKDPAPKSDVVRENAKAASKTVKARTGSFRARRNSGPTATESMESHSSAKTATRRPRVDVEAKTFGGSPPEGRETTEHKVFTFDDLGLDNDSAPTGEHPTIQMPVLPNDSDAKPSSPAES